MVATAWWQIAIAGMCGPLIIELAKIATWRSFHRTRERWGNPLYWISFFTFVLLGGALATLVLYGEGNSISVLRAIHIGATSPLIVSAWASAESGHANSRARSRRSARVIPGRDTDDAHHVSGLDRFKQAVRW